MAYIYRRGSKWWCRVKEAGKWISCATPFSTSDPADQRKAKRFAERVQAKIQERRQDSIVVKAGPLTVKQYVTMWIQRRREADLDWKTDYGRLKHRKIKS